MPLDTNGHQIYPGDVVACTVSHYSDMECGYTTIVDDVSPYSIYLEEFNHLYATPARFTSTNFILRPGWPKETLLPKIIRGRNVNTKEPKMALNTLPLFIAVRIDGQPNMNVLAELISSNRNAAPIMCAVSLDSIQSLVRDDIRIHDNHQWVILSPLMIGETASQPVKFRSLRSL